MSVIDRFLALDLPTDDCVVIASGILDALGLRVSRDIDIVVSPVLFLQLQASGDWVSRVVHDETKLEKDDVEVWQSWGSDSVPNFTTLFDDSVVIKGVHFAHPQFVIAQKRHRGMEKDLKDIMLLEEYLKNDR